MRLAITRHTALGMFAAAALLTILFFPSASHQDLPELCEQTAYSYAYYSNAACEPPATYGTYQPRG